MMSYMTVITVTYYVTYVMVTQFYDMRERHRKFQNNDIIQYVLHMLTL